MVMVEPVMLPSIDYVWWRDVSKRTARIRIPMQGQGKLTYTFSAEHHRLSAFCPSPSLLVPCQHNIGAESGSGKSLRKAENVYVGLSGPTNAGKQLSSAATDV